MDSSDGISDILSTFMNNPDMMKKVMDVLPLITQLKSNNTEVSAQQDSSIQTEQSKSSVQSFAPVPENSLAENNTNNIQQPVQNNNGSNISSETIAQMVSSVLSSLGMNNINNNNMENNSTINDVGARNNDTSAQMPLTTDNTQQVFASSSSSSIPATNTDRPIATENTQNNTQSNFDIEKALGVLKTVSKETSPDKDNRIRLLLALKPFMKNGRQQKIDVAIKYLNAAKVFNMFGKTGFI